MKTNPLPLSPLAALLLLIFCSSGPTGAFAQSSEPFSPGTIELRDGTERSGSIYYTEWVQTPESIRFKGPEDSAPRSYTPEDLAGFAVAGRRYRTASVLLSPDFADLSTEKPRMRFLREELLGQVSLYSHVGEKEQLHLFLDPGTGPVELVYRKYRPEERGYGYQTETDEKFRGQLKYLLRDCPRVARHSDNVAYSRRAMVDLVADYHDCIGAPVTVRYERSRTDRRLQVVPLIGVVHSRLSYETDRQRLAGVDFPGSTNLTAGIGMEIVLAPRVRSLTAYTEFLYQQGDFQDDHTFVTSFFTEATATQTARFSQLRNNLGLRVNILPRSDLFFFSVGITNVLFTDIEVVEEITAPSVTDGDPINTRNTAFGFHADLGARVGNFRLLLRYDADNGFSLDPTVSTPVRHYRVLVGYSL